jgi:putative endonuclease
MSGRYYVGSCSNPQKRLQQHNAGRTPSTKPFRPWELIYTETFNTNSEALKRELQIKKMKSRKYIEGLITCKL